MSAVHGTMYTCERCGKSIFCADGEFDEAVMKGWGSLCPECSALWGRVSDLFYKYGTKEIEEMIAEMGRENDDGK